MFRQLAEEILPLHRVSTTQQEAIDRREQPLGKLLQLRYGTLYCKCWISTASGVVPSPVHNLEWPPLRIMRSYRDLGDAGLALGSSGVLSHKHAWIGSY